MNDMNETLYEQEYPVYIPIDEFIAGMNINAFVDDDGYGHLAKMTSSDEEPYVDFTRTVYPSTLKNVGDIGDYTHILWFNK